jgi:hypothetical protein
MCVVANGRVVLIYRKVADANTRDLAMVTREHAKIELAGHAYRNDQADIFDAGADAESAGERSALATHITGIPMLIIAALKARSCRFSQITGTPTLLFISNAGIRGMLQPRSTQAGPNTSKSCPISRVPRPSLSYFAALRAQRRHL